MGGLHCDRVLRVPSGDTIHDAHLLSLQALAELITTASIEQDTGDWTTLSTFMHAQHRVMLAQAERLSAQVFPAGDAEAQAPADKPNTTEPFEFVISTAGYADVNLPDGPRVIRFCSHEEEHSGWAITGKELVELFELQPNSMNSRKHRMADMGLLTEEMTFIHEGETHWTVAGAAAMLRRYPPRGRKLSEATKRRAAAILWLDQHLQTLKQEPKWVHTAIVSRGGESKVISGELPPGVTTADQLVKVAEGAINGLGALVKADPGQDPFRNPTVDERAQYGENPADSWLGVYRSIWPSIRTMRGYAGVLPDFVFLQNVEEDLFELHAVFHDGSSTDATRGDGAHPLTVRIDITPGSNQLCADTIIPFRVLMKLAGEVAQSTKQASATMDSWEYAPPRHNIQMTIDQETQTVHLAIIENMRVRHDINTPLRDDGSIVLLFSDDVAKLLGVTRQAITRTLARNRRAFEYGVDYRQMHQGQPLPAASSDLDDKLSSNKDLADDDTNTRSVPVMWTLRGLFTHLLFRRDKRLAQSVFSQLTQQAFSTNPILEAAKPVDKNRTREDRLDELERRMDEQYAMMRDLPSAVVKHIDRLKQRGDDALLPVGECENDVTDDGISKAVDEMAVVPRNDAPRVPTRSRVGAGLTEPTTGWSVRLMPAGFSGAVLRDAGVDLLVPYWQAPEGGGAELDGEAQLAQHQTLARWATRILHDEIQSLHGMPSAVGNGLPRDLCVTTTSILEGVMIGNTDKSLANLQQHNGASNYEPAKSLHKWLNEIGVMRRISVVDPARAIAVERYVAEYRQEPARPLPFNLNVAGWITGPAWDDKGELLYTEYATSRRFDAAVEYALRQLTGDVDAPVEDTPPDQMMLPVTPDSQLRQIRPQVMWHPQAACFISAVLRFMLLHAWRAIPPTLGWQGELDTINERD
jgi:hypothetical protein